MQEGILHKEITKVGTSDGTQVIMDVLAVEEPIEIRIHAPHAIPPVSNKNISITMRTPGNDADLAIGFLYTEGIIHGSSQIKEVQHIDNVATVFLHDQVSLDLSKMERHFYTTSSCGVCGKSSLDAIKTVCPFPKSQNIFSVKRSFVMNLPGKLDEKQSIFQDTGGLHAAAIFNLDGELMLVREDVGRHNALDKVIGAALMDNEGRGYSLPLSRNVLLLSGRASFELLQKAVMAGISFVCAVGAPSSMAVQLAEEHGVTLIGFLNDRRFNIYSAKHRVEL